MINTESFLAYLQELGIMFYAGVPDSLLKEFCACLTEKIDADHHKICANEGNAVAMAAGHYLATGSPALVYLQNSGLGNCVNPLLSLADKEVYGIPVLLLIGWRGEPGVKDEPQHIKQGRIQNNLLETMEIPYIVMDANSDDIRDSLKRMLSLALELSHPVAIVVKKGSFSQYEPASQNKAPFPGLMRQRALEIVLETMNDAIVVSTTGKTSREVNEIRKESGKQGMDFLCVGSMGHASSIALGIALEQRAKVVICLDGDGALLMHMGAMALIGNSLPKNFVHIMFNNRCYESVGGQATPMERVNFKLLTEALGYREYLHCETEDELDCTLAAIHGLPGPIFLNISTIPGSRADLGRPDTTPQDNKHRFMKSLKELS
ncbi:MAG TPA: phosphonopyruvate decarboxylase [Candidatus Cloacimonadota bacterium]|nr:phosphonopyruvate decarboxylase [Candidatus Cloacimonadota bacterium]